MSEIIFVLEKVEKGYVVIKLSVAGEKRKRFLYREFLESFRKQQGDLEELMRAELRYRRISERSSQADTVPFNEVHIPLERAEMWLKRVGYAAAREEAPTVEEKRVSPLPVLQLMDPRGACADLWMEYGEGRGISFHDPRTPEWRDRAEEKGWEDDLLEVGYRAKIIEDAHYFCSPETVPERLTFLIEMGWRVQDREGRAVRLFSSSALSVAQEGEVLVVTGAATFDEDEVPLTSVLGAYQRNAPFLTLSESSVGLIDRKMIAERWGALATQKVCAGQVRLQRSHFGILKSLPDLPKEVCPSPAQFAEVVPSERFKGALHPYQRLGLSYLKFLCAAGFHGLLADEMGLGKTVQVLAFFSLLEDKGPHLVVMPTSLLFNWRREFETFLPGTPLTVHAGPSRARSLSELPPEGVILTSYAVLRQDAEILCGLKCGCVVLDEAHVIRNAKAQVTRAAYALQARFRLALTGTPLINAHDDIKSLFHFLMPQLLEGSEGALREKIAPFILRRTKGEVAHDLPPKVEQTLYVEMEEGQAALYNDLLEKSRQGLVEKIAADGAEAHRMEILEVILRLRQICCHPHLVDPSAEASSAKLDALLLDIEEMCAQGSKVLVYSQFTSMLKLIQQALDARALPTLYLDGSTKDREKVVETFQTDPDKRLFLCSLKAGGVGLNLQCADYVLLFDPWWNVAIEDQAIARAHRLGRKGTLIAKRYLTIHSVEEKMEEIKKTKTQMDLGQQMPDQKLKLLNTDEMLKLLE